MRVLYGENTSHVMLGADGDITDHLIKRRVKDSHVIIVYNDDYQDTNQAIGNMISMRK